LKYGKRLASCKLAPRLGGSLALPILLVAISASAADVVFIRSTKPGQPPVQRQGEIVDLAGQTLQFRGPAGNVEAIPLAQVTEWRTTWTMTKLQADALLAERKFTDAAAAYARARDEDLRTWARRQIIERLIECHLATGNTVSAAEEFFILVASDPETPAWELAPLAWKPNSEPEIAARAGQWFRDTRNPAKQLIGASHLLVGPQRADAATALQSLSTGPNKTIASLAAIQLWRSRVASSTPDEPARWLAGLERLPSEVRPGGYFVIGEAFARHNQPEQAALAYMRIPVLYPRQRPLSAEALLAAAAQLEKMGKREQGAELVREVLTEHAQLPIATIAKQRWEQLTQPAATPN